MTRMMMTIFRKRVKISEDDENDSEGVKTLKVSPLFVGRTW